MHLKVASAKWRPFCLGLNVLNMVSCVYTPRVYVQYLFSYMTTCVLEAGMKGKDK